MPPKKSDTTAAKAKSAATHPSYQDMITSAIISLKDRNGSSRMKLKKYVKANNNVGNVGDKMFDALFNKALKTGVEKGVFEQPKGPSGGTKLAKKAHAPKKEVEKPVAKKPAPKKEKKEVEKKEVKKPAPKKAAPKKEVKKPVAKPAAAKKAAPKKSAPAVVEKPTVLSKTKSGRVTKIAAKPVVDKKKKAPAKKATPKKKEAAA